MRKRRRRRKGGGRKEGRVGREGEYEQEERKQEEWGQGGVKGERKKRGGGKREVVLHKISPFHTILLLLLSYLSTLHVPHDGCLVHPTSHNVASLGVPLEGKDGPRVLYKSGL